MLPTVIITAAIVLAVFFYYLFYIRPKLDPLYRAGAFERQDLLREAVLEYNKALETHPKDFITHYRLANLHQRLGEVDRTMHHLERILEIDRFNYEVDRVNVLKRLAELYYEADNIEKAFQTYYEVLNQTPNDYDALYYLAFISLGQEEFEFAQRYFERLVKAGRNEFEIYFGAGICSYQNQRIPEAVGYFKSALAVRPHSDIGNLSMAFACQAKKDVKQALHYAGVVAGEAEEPEVKYIAHRLLALLSLQDGNYDDAISSLREALEIARSRDLQDQLMLALYDLGFAAAKAGRHRESYEAWRELFQADREYRDVKKLVALARKDAEGQKKTGDEFEESAADYYDQWLAGAFPLDFIWNICGLRSERRFDVRNVMVTARVSTGREGGAEGKRVAGDYADRLEAFCRLDVESFRIMANRVVTKMGYKVDQILQTYREADGVDFLAYSMATKEKTLIWVRRWTKTMAGEITLRNFAQAITDQKAKQGIFITTIDLTDAAKANLDKLSKVMVIYPDQLNEFLRGIL